jgi:arylsulfatase A-like enzyme
MKRLFITSLLAFAVCAAATAADKPNLIFILADDLGYSDLGCYGGEIETPHLDSLAKGGLRFTQAYNTARCWPTRAALLTGYYAPQVHADVIPDVPNGGRGARQNWARLLPDFLKPSGYRSYHSGKWHLTGGQIASGFDHSYDLAHQGSFFRPKRLTEDDQPLPPTAPDSGYYATTAVADHAIKYLKEHAQQHAEKPFFAYIAFTSPHFPLHALPEDIAKYRDRYKSGWEAMRAARHQRMKEMGIVNTELSAVERNVGPPYDFPDDIALLGPGEVNKPIPWNDLTPEQKDFQAMKMAIHAAMVDRMDQEIGRILAQLKAMNAFDNTIIMFSSDNGASAEIMVRDDGHDPKASPGSALTHLCLGPGFSSACNTPFRRHKTWVHEGGISTPLVVHWPKGIAARGELRHNPTHLIDIVPTYLEVAGVTKPGQWNGEPIPPAPGKSLVAAFAKDNAVSQEYLWWLHEGNRAIRIGDWKLVAAKDDPWELYDLKNDRAEQRNLASENPDKVKELSDAWTKKTAEFAALSAKTPELIGGGKKGGGKGDGKKKKKAE